MLLALAAVATVWSAVAAAALPLLLFLTGAHLYWVHLLAVLRIPYKADRLTNLCLAFRRFGRPKISVFETLLGLPGGRLGRFPSQPDHADFALSESMRKRNCFY